LVYFWYVVPRKIWQPWAQTGFENKIRQLKNVVKKFSAKVQVFENRWKLTKRILTKPDRGYKIAACLAMILQVLHKIGGKEFTLF
jgi:hypothetical protein